MQSAALFSAQSRFDTTQDRRNLFRDLILEYVDYGREAGVTLHPFRDSTLPFYQALQESEQSRVLRALESCVSVCRMTRAQGHVMSDSPALVWSFLRHFKFRPTSDLFSHITNESVIEVHSLEGIQLFRNFNFYKYCSYTVEDLYCRPWPLLFTRDDDMIDSLISFVSKVHRGEWTSTLPLNMRRHRVKELFSFEQNEVWMDMKLGAPLYEEGQGPAATVIIESIEPIASAPRSKGVEYRQSSPQNYF